MSTFSPYKYNMSNFKTTQINNRDLYYQTFTFLSKPEKRNTFKLSLAHMINYLVDFGIGYNSVCVTTITTQQSFNTGMYVNRHDTKSKLRPATAVDFKEKIIGAVKAMIRHTVNYYNGSTVKNKWGLVKTNTLYPKYLFTLDTSLTPEKLFKITGQTYVEVKDFQDFAHTSEAQYLMPNEFKDGYVEAKDMLLCPAHTHTTDLSRHINYSCGASIKPPSNAIWSGTLRQGEFLNDYPGPNGGKFAGDSYTKFDNGRIRQTEGQCGTTEVNCSVSPSWKYPTDVKCYESEKKNPINTIDVDGKNVVTLRYPGRRYRLFKLSTAIENPITLSTNEITVNANG